MCASGSQVLCSAPYPFHETRSTATSIPLMLQFVARPTDELPLLPGHQDVMVESVHGESDEERKDKKAMKGEIMTTRQLHTGSP